MEVFAIFFLDARHRIIAFEPLFRGALDKVVVHPRDAVRRALVHNAATVIFAHNHPSGVAEPSRADRDVTGRLEQALAAVNVHVLDHLVGRRRWRDRLVRRARLALTVAGHATAFAAARHHSLRHRP